MTEMSVIASAEQDVQGLAPGRYLLSADLVTVEPEYVDGRPTGRVCVGAWVKDGFREFVMVDPPS